MFNGTWVLHAFEKVLSAAIALFLPLSPNGDKGVFHYDKKAIENKEAISTTGAIHT